MCNRIINIFHSREAICLRFYDLDVCSRQCTKDSTPTYFKTCRATIVEGNGVLDDGAGRYVDAADAADAAETKCLKKFPTFLHRLN